MKNKLFVLLIGFLFTFFLGLISCEDDNCGPFANKFKTVDLDWRTLKAVYSDTAASKLILTEIENDSVYYELYSISIFPLTESYFAQNTNNWSFNLIQSAYACTPPIPSTDEKIDSIIIVSETDFDINHPAGTDLSGLFDIVLSDYSQDLRQERFSLDDFLTTNGIVPSELSLILNGQPDETSEFEFLVKYFQDGVDDNDYFEYMTDKVTIKRE